MREKELTKDVLYAQAKMRAREIENYMKMLERETKLLPKEKIYSASSHGSSQYHIVNTKNQKTYLSKKHISKITDCVQREYNEKVLVELDKELVTLKCLEKNYKSGAVEQIYLDMPEAKRMLVEPVISTDDEYVKAWQAVEYEHMGFAEGSPEYYTDKGERVRSKSEVIIANKLFSNGVPYRYEFPIYKDGKVVSNADFLCLNVARRKEYVWEHFGMMDNEDYANSAVKKIANYQKMGYYLGQNMIATFESGICPQNTYLMEDLIKKFLL